MRKYISDIEYDFLTLTTTYLSYTQHIPSKQMKQSSFKVFMDLWEVGVKCTGFSRLYVDNTDNF